VATRYEAAGLGRHVRLPEAHAGAAPAWHLYVVGHTRADALIDGLRELGIEARSYYRTPAHRQPALEPYVSRGLSLPATEELASTNLALPMGPTLSRSEVEAVVAGVERVLAGA
jgi:dTDP-4-amino-4,6-dideoxygalactose transaminase